VDVLLLAASDRLSNGLGAVLEGRRHRLTICASLQDALQAAANGSIDVVLFDADQPPVAADQICRSFRRILGPTVVLVALTRKRQMPFYRQLVDAGVDDYLVLDEQQWSLTLRLQLLERAVARRNGYPASGATGLLADAVGRLLPRLPNMLVIVDRHGLIQCANRGPRHLRPDQLVGKMGFNFLVPRARRAGRLLLEKTFRHGEPQSMAVWDIFDLHWQVRLLPFADRLGEPFVLVACNDATSRKRTEESLHEFQRSLEHILECQERSRENAARLLHDEIAQQLTSVLFALETLAASEGHNTELQRQAMEMSRKTLKETIAMCCRLADALTPLGLRKFGLMSAVECLVEEVRARRGPAIHVHVEGELGRLSPPLELTLFRIIEKLVMVVHPLGHDRTVRLGLQRDDRLVCLDFRVDCSDLEPDQLVQFRQVLQELAARAKVAGGTVLPMDNSSREIRFSVLFPIGLR